MKSRAVGAALKITHPPAQDNGENMAISGKAARVADAARLWRKISKLPKRWRVQLPISYSSSYQTESE
jgi:hypothetical protein